MIMKKSIKTYSTIVLGLLLGSIATAQPNFGLNHQTVKLNFSVMNKSGNIDMSEKMVKKYKVTVNTMEPASCYNSMSNEIHYLFSSSADTKSINCDGMQAPAYYRYIYHAELEGMYRENPLQIKINKKRKEVIVNLHGIPGITKKLDSLTKKQMQTSLFVLDSIPFRPGTYRIDVDEYMDWQTIKKTWASGATPINITPKTWMKEENN